MDSLSDLDNALREAMVACCCIVMDDKCWNRATLPATSGGVGLRSAADMALPQFLASVNATSLLTDRLCNGVQDAAREIAESKWSDTWGARPSDKEAMFALSWARPSENVKHKRAQNSAASRSDLSRFLSAATPEAAVLWTGLPNSQIGTRLSDSAFTVALGLRLGLPVATPGTCRCGRDLDVFGDHALTCGKGVGRGARHAEINSRIRSFLSEAGCPSVLEPTGLVRSDGKRPDGATVLPFDKGLPMAWDATVRHTSASSYLHLTSISAGAAAAAAEAAKDKKYAALADRIHFVPVGLETLGAFGPSAKDLFDELSSRIRARTGNSGARNSLYRRIAAAIQIGNAACILEAHSNMSKLPSEPALAAAPRVVL